MTNPLYKKQHCLNVTSLSLPLDLKEGEVCHVEDGWVILKALAYY